MITGLWGKKIGMTQLFNEEKVVPVTAIELSGWHVTGIKTQVRDGYDAIQVGLLRKRFSNVPFSLDWLKKSNKYFIFIREIKISAESSAIEIGQSANTFISQFTEGQNVDVVGTTKGCGFAGVVKRHGFTGARASHGSKMGRRTGSLSFMRSQGRVIKGKKMPGHLGTVQRTTKNLSVVKVEADSLVVFIKGSISGKSGSLVFVRKA